MSEEQKKWEETDRLLDEIGRECIAELPVWDGKKATPHNDNLDARTRLEKLNNLAKKIRGSLVYAN